MIQASLATTKRSTFAVTRPDPDYMGSRQAVGTGFMVRPDGYFLTALHVLDECFTAAGKLVLEQLRGGADDLEISGGELIAEWPDHDLALMKFDPLRRSGEAGHSPDGRFAHLDIRFAPVDEGTKVYAFGYPLPRSKETSREGQGRSEPPRLPQHAPRITSGIVSSSVWRRTLGEQPAETAIYALDRPFLEGNSGGPVVLEETGEAFAVAIKNQWQEVVQEGGSIIRLPSPYGLAVSLGSIATELTAALDAGGQ